MNHHFLNINDARVSKGPTVFTCYGLGSCLGVFITDRVNKISGGAHIPLPQAINDGNFQGATIIMNELLEQFRNLGSDLMCLRAKVTGGAKLLAHTIDIGNQNTETVLRLLANNKIYLAATDVGGTISRTARYNSVTGDLSISTSERKTYSI